MDSIGIQRFQTIKLRNANHLKTSDEQSFRYNQVEAKSFSEHLLKKLTRKMEMNKICSSDYDYEGILQSYKGKNQVPEYKALTPVGNFTNDLSLLRI